MFNKVKLAFFFIFVVLFILVVDFMLEDKFEITSGISIGNALDSPLGESWGVEISTDMLDDIKNQGFDTVRLPVRFSDYIDANYKINEDFLRNIDLYIDYAIDLELYVILDLHHFVELIDHSMIGYNDEKILPSDFDYMKAYYEIWEQLSIRYKDYSEYLVFELFNEPSNNITADIWNEMVDKSISLIRKTNPYRLIVVSTAEMAIAEAVSDLELPDDDNLVVTFHLYSPMEFTFQNDENHGDYSDMGIIEWNGTREEVEDLEYRFKVIDEFASENNVNVLLGEFGVVKNAPEESRLKYIETIVSLADKYNFGYVYWELAHNFGIYDADSRQWNSDIINILNK